MFAKGDEDVPRWSAKHLTGRADEAVGDVIGVAFVAHEDLHIDACLGFDGFPLVLPIVGDDEFFDGFVDESVHGC